MSVDSIPQVGSINLNVSLLLMSGRMAAYRTECGARLHDISEYQILTLENCRMVRIESMHLSKSLFLLSFTEESRRNNLAIYASRSRVRSVVFLNEWIILFFAEYWIWMNTTGHNVFAITVIQLVNIKPQWTQYLTVNLLSMAWCMMSGPDIMHHA